MEFIGTRRRCSAARKNYNTSTLELLMTDKNVNLRDAFAEKVVWITGTSSRIGEGLALAFAQSGAHVMLSGRK